MTEKLIRMYAFEPCCLTVKEFEQLLNEVRGRILAQDWGVSDLILSRIITENFHRYKEIKG